MTYRTVIGWIKPVFCCRHSALADSIPISSRPSLRTNWRHPASRLPGHLLQTLVETTAVHHPAVWWLSRRIRRTRKTAATISRSACAGESVHVREGTADLEELRISGRFVMAATGIAGSARPQAPGAPTHAWPRACWLAGSASVLVMLAWAAARSARTASRPRSLTPPSPAPNAPAADAVRGALPSRYPVVGVQRPHLSCREPAERSRVRHNSRSCRPSRAA